MEALLPSEIARLVWGYLQKECPSAGHVFLKNSAALAEFRDAKQKSRRLLDTVNGHTLLDLLSDMSDTFNYVVEMQAMLSEEARLEVRNKFSLCDKVEMLVHHVKSASSNNASMEERDSETLGERDFREGSPVEIGTFADDVLNTSPVRALMANLANKLKQSKTNVPFKKRRMTGSPSMNLEATSDDSAMAASAEMDPILQPLLKNTQFHEKIAESINKILQPKASCDDILNKDLNEAIHQVVQETEKDQTFEDIIQEICQVGSQAAFSDGGSEDNGLHHPFSPPPPLDLDSNSQDIAQPNELHTPDPEDAEIQNTPTRGRKSKPKGTPAKQMVEVPLKARLRSASKMGHRDEDQMQDNLQHLNDEAVWNIVEAIPDIEQHTAPPPVETTSLANSETCQSALEKSLGANDGPEITLEIPLSLAEQQSISIFNEPLPLSTIETEQETRPEEIVEPPAPILPPVRVHPNPPMPVNPVGSLILIMEPNQSTVPEPQPEPIVFAQRLFPLAPKGELRAVPHRYNFQKSRIKKKADRNINQKTKEVKVKGKKLPPANIPPPIITMDGVVIQPPSEIIAQDYPNVSAPGPEEAPTPEIIPPTPQIEMNPPTPEIIPPTPEVVPPTPEIIPPTPDHAVPNIICASPSVLPRGAPLMQLAFVSMPSISPAQPAMASAHSAAQGQPAAAPPARAPSPVAVVASENSTERPIEARRSLSTPRRGSNYVRTLDFSTPPQNKMTARRALTSPKAAQPKNLAAAKNLTTAAKIVRSGLFDKSPDAVRSKKSKKLSLITEEEQVEQPIESNLPILQTSPEVEKSTEVPTEPSTPPTAPVAQPPAEKSPEKASPAETRSSTSKKSSSWDAELRAQVGPVLDSPSKKSPSKSKRHRIGGDKAPPKKRKSSPKKTPNKEIHIVEESPEKSKPEKPKGSTKKRQKTPTKRRRAALRTLNDSPPNTRVVADKERLLESLQLSPSKVPPRVPEPTISLNNPRMSLYSCSWEGSSPGNFVPQVDRTYCMTVSVEGESGEEVDISLKWTAADVWDSLSGVTEKRAEEEERGPPEKRRRLQEVVEEEVADDDDLMTFALVASTRAKAPCSPSKEWPRSKSRSPNESSNPQDMLRKVGVDNLLSALHGETKK